MIPADAYRVERTGDGEGGFLTRLVLPDDEGRVEAGGGAGDAAEGPSHNDKSKKKKTKKKKSKEGGGDRGETGAEQSTVEEAPAKEGGEAGEVAAAKERLKKERLERKKLKRKAKREMAKERKRLRREAEGSQNSSIAAPSPKATGESPEGSEIDEKGRSGSAETSDGADDGAARQAEIERLQTAWSIAAPGVTLHPTLCAGLHSMGYAHPTPIQSASLPAAILGRRDIVGAAPTGSGKTLSYGLPILQRLLEGDDPPEGVASEEGAAKEGGKGSAEGRRPLQALVLTPTRELALQVTAELSRVCGDQVKIGTIVGGFAEVKQRRTLERTRPPVLVGTPGRLWELVSRRARRGIPQRRSSSPRALFVVVSYSPREEVLPEGLSSSHGSSLWRGISSLERSFEQCPSSGTQKRGNNLTISSSHGRSLDGSSFKRSSLQHFDDGIPQPEH